MNQSQITGMLYKQLELLAERSEKCADEELAEITQAMLKITGFLNPNLPEIAIGKIKKTTIVIKSAIPQGINSAKLSQKLLQQLDRHKRTDMEG
ncbi:hypothetical protein [Paenibacillus campi]|uniref:hypothetical protein n=1 Tax=Paenibacillus campi TaxID=3106031 RepID=UPI002AFE9500|nr:hypothetical protein [Paenibacillus sp. SGZ-1014]